MRRFKVLLALALVFLASYRLLSTGWHPAIVIGEALAVTVMVAVRWGRAR